MSQTPHPTAQLLKLGMAQAVRFVVGALLGRWARPAAGPRCLRRRRLRQHGDRRHPADRPGRRRRRATGPAPGIGEPTAETQESTEHGVRRTRHPEGRAASRWCRCRWSTKHGLRAAAADGELWKLRVTSVPEPQDTRAYIETALQTRAGQPLRLRRDRRGQRRGAGQHQLPRHPAGASSAWRSATPGTPARCQRTHVNTTCKLLMLTHAFDTLGCNVVGWRTDNFNFASQRAIERLGAQQGRRDPRPRAAPRRHHPRHRDVQPALRANGPR